MFLCAAVLFGGLTLGCEEPQFSGPDSVHSMNEEFAGWDTGKTLIVFTEPGCAPCMRDRPIVEEIKSQGRPKGLKVITVDGSQHPQIADDFGVEEYPTYVLCEDGEVREMSTSIKVILKAIKLIFKIAIFFIFL
jgi:thiol-disulfide isomerase/thioredoxin